MVSLHRRASSPQSHPQYMTHIGSFKVPNLYCSQEMSGMCGLRKNTHQSRTAASQNTYGAKREEDPSVEPAVPFASAPSLHFDAVLGQARTRHPLTLYPCCPDCFARDET